MLASLERHSDSVFSTLLYNHGTRAIQLFISSVASAARHSNKYPIPYNRKTPKSIAAN